MAETKAEREKREADEAAAVSSIPEGGHSHSPGEDLGIEATEKGTVDPAKVIEVLNTDQEVADKFGYRPSPDSSGPGNLFGRDGPRLGTGAKPEPQTAESDEG